MPHLAQATNSAQLAAPADFIFFCEFLMGTKDNGPMVGVGPANGSSSKLPALDLTITNDMVYNLPGNSIVQDAGPARRRKQLRLRGWAREVGAETLGRQWWMQPPAR